MPKPRGSLAPMRGELGPQKGRTWRRPATLCNDANLRSLPTSGHELRRIPRRFASRPRFVPAILHPFSDLRGSELWTSGPKGSTEPATRLYTVTGKHHLHMAQHSLQGQEHPPSRFHVHAQPGSCAWPATQGYLLAFPHPLASTPPIRACHRISHQSEQNVYKTSSETTSCRGRLSLACINPNHGPARYFHGPTERPVSQVPVPSSRGIGHLHTAHCSPLAPSLKRRQNSDAYRTNPLTVQFRSFVSKVVKPS